MPERSRGPAGRPGGAPASGSGPAAGQRGPVARLAPERVGPGGEHERAAEGGRRLLRTWGHGREASGRQVESCVRVVLRRITASSAKLRACLPSPPLPSPPLPPPIASTFTFPSMGGEAMVRLESASLDRAALEALAEGVHARRGDRRGRALALPPRQRAERAQRRPALRRPRLRAAAAHGRRGELRGPARGGLVDATRLGALERSATRILGRRSAAPTSTRPRRRSAAPARRARALAGEGGWSIDAEGRVTVRPGCGSTPAASRRGRGRPGGGRAAPDVRFAIGCGGDVAAGGGASRGRSPSPAPAARPRSTACACAPAASRPRASQRASGAAGRQLGPPRARPRHGPARVDRARRRDRGRGRRARGRGARKTALLSGPLAARRRLRRRGGVLQHDDGRIEVIPAPAIVRLPPRRRRAAA